MKLVDFLIHTGKYCMGAVAVGSLGACAGYTFGTLSRGNSLLAAQTLAIAAVAAYIFRQCVEHGLDDMRDSSTNFVYILGTSLGGATFTIALKNLEIISRIGTAVLGMLFLLPTPLFIYAHYEAAYVFA